MPPPIEPSPQPPKNPDDRTQSGEMRAVVEPMLEESMRQHDRKMTFRGWLMAVITAVGAVAATVVITLIFIDNRVLAQTAQSNAVQDAKQEALKARVETLEKRFDRFDAKMDLMLDAQRVPEWKRPPPLDGGR
jgi:cell division protein FtsB